MSLFNLKLISNKLKENPPNINMPLARKKQQNNIVVHMGGIDSRGAKARMEKRAKKHPTLRFLEINQKRPYNANTKNLKIIQGDFVDCLKRQKDESIGLIRGEMSIGYYGRAKGEMPKTQSKKDVVKYTKQIINLAYKKLKRNGKLTVLVENELHTQPALDNLLVALKQSPFKKEQVELKTLTPQEAMVFNDWTRSAVRLGAKVYRIVIKKS